MLKLNLHKIQTVFIFLLIMLLSLLNNPVVAGSQNTGNPLKIGIIASYSGPYADYGRQFDAGMQVYLAKHGGKIAGRPVQIIRKDTAGPAPDLSIRFAKELIVREGVHLISGLDFSPNASAIASVVTQGKTPTIIMNAAASGLTKNSPYMARVAFTVAQVSAPMAQWIYKQGITSAYTVVANYGPGHDAEATFHSAFKQLGGKITGQVRTPMSNPDFAAYVQKIKDLAPQAVFVFFPSGVMPPAFLKAWHEKGLDQAGIRLFATGEATDDSYLAATGDVALGLITSHHYSYAHKSDTNAAFIKNFRSIYGDSFRPSYFAVAAYDALAAFDAALSKTDGRTNPEEIMQALAGLSIESPRGPILIDKSTRDIIQTVYIRRTEKINNELVNIEFDQFDQVADPMNK